jgi:hypothetical protein
LRVVSKPLAFLVVLLAFAPPAEAQTKGIWVSLATIQQRPTSGSAWQALRSAADGSLGVARVADHHSGHDTRTLAVALVYARTGAPAYRSKAATAILSAIGTEAGGRTLALGRNLVSYVIAADLVNLSEYDPAGDRRFRSWLASVRTAVLDGSTLIETHETRPNNWGTHAGASRVAADLYLGDLADLARAAQVFKGWLGDRSAYAGFKYGDLAWQSDPAHPVGINPAGATIQGHPVDGVLPDDQRRGGSFVWPPFKENYAWEALQGATVEAELLTRAGYPAWQWQDRALQRAATWLYQQASYPAEGDDTWQPWLINAAYGTSFPTSAARTGKNMGWTDWTHGPSASAPPWRFPVGLIAGLAALVAAGIFMLVRRRRAKEAAHRHRRETDTRQPPGR